MSKKHLILFVDDEESILNAMSRVFAFENQYEIITTTHAQEALEIINQKPVDLVISDQRMPEMEGTDLLKEVKKRRPEIMRILLSGYSDFEALINAINEGEIFRFIAKPWDNKELQTIIQNAIAQKEAMEVVNLIAKQVTHAISDTAAVNVVTLQDDKNVYLKLDSDRPIIAGDILSNIFQLINRIREKKGDVVNDISCSSGSVEKTQSKLIFTVYVGKGFSLVIEIPSECKKNV